MNNKRIELRNCKCIKEASLIISDNSLNIKYAPNGTGKSTIGDAIYQSSNGGIIKEEMTPLCGEDLKPEVQCAYKKVMIFNSEYIKKFIFEKSGNYEQGYNVLIKNDRIEEISKQINSLTKSLQSLFEEDKEIDELVMLLNAFNGIIKVEDGKLIKRGAISEIIKGNGAGFDLRKDLERFKPYYDNKASDVALWAKWRNDYKGPNIETIGKCPYCCEDIGEEFASINEEFKVAFKKSSLETTNNITVALNDGKNEKLLNESSVNRLVNNFGDCSKASELEKDLKDLASEAEYLLSKIERIKHLKEITIIDDVEEIEKRINESILDKSYLNGFFNTNELKNIIDRINDNISSIQGKINEVKGLYKSQSDIIQKIIKKNESDINEFLELAGFPYQFKIFIENGKETKTSLIFKNKQLGNPGLYLSWGEKNAFAVVMFMFEALFECADLIILDDPFSSIDKFKKHAIISRLFSNKKDIKSLNGKTVILLTHDSQPLIDYVYAGVFKKNLCMGVSAHYLLNSDNIIKEKEITSNSLVNVYTMHFGLKNNNKMKWPIRITSARKICELTDNDYINSELYEGLSNLIHGRKVIIKSDGTKYSDNEEKIIKKKIENEFSLGYDEILEELTEDNLKDYICTGDDNYLKAISARLLLLRNSELLGQVCKKTPGLRKFLNETNHVEDDYVFQLDPFEFPEIPLFFIEKIRQTIEMK